MTTHDSLGLSILDVVQTPFLRREGERLLQLIRVRVAMPASCEAELELDGQRVFAGRVEAGDQEVTFFRPEAACASDAVLTLRAGSLEARHSFVSVPPKHLSVHVVQLSHHDLGYTDVPSRVLEDYYRWIAELLDIADALEARRGDERFRVVLEQGWSVVHFLRTAPAADRERLIRRIREGDFELTALYGNQITEIMGHEEMYRLMYPAMRIAREAGVSLVSAEHNDETGVSWGLCRALCDAGVKIICPGMALYYSWGGRDLPSFWDERRVFDAEGPGAFWWEAPDGKRLLFWCNNSGCGGDNSGTLDSLYEKINRLCEQQWPYEVLRWPVGGANRDNSPYARQWSDAICDWNQQWAYPHLICSTNALFYEEFTARLKRELPVRRGDLPGQDYPPGSMSLPEATIAARGAQRLLTKAETAASLVRASLGAPAQDRCIREAYEDLLRSDEHAYGYHFPAGYAMRAGQMEKRVFGARAQAFADEVAQKALAALSDSAQSAGYGFRLLVYNPGAAGALSVETPMREFDNTGSEIMTDNKSSARRGYLLNHRMHANPDAGLAMGRFELIDIASGERVPFQVDAIDPDAPEPFAPERHGLSQGTRRYGMFEEPVGLRQTLRFVARDVPAYGYKTYALVPKEEAPDGGEEAAGFIESEYYRLSWDEGGVVSLTDRLTGAELLDGSCPHRLGQVLVRHGNELHPQPMSVASIDARRGKVVSTLTLRGSARGIPAIALTFCLWKGLRKLEIAARILRDGTPMLNAHLAFPLTGSGFQYGGPLCAITPVADFLPGAQSDALAVCDWVRVQGSNVRFETLDSPIVSLGALHPGYVSPAHRCNMPEDIHHPLTLEDYRSSGWIYSMLYSNNYGTNWAVSGSGETLYRYVLGEDCACAMTIFSDRSNDTLPAQHCLLRVEGGELIALKRAEDGNGYIARLWNRTCEPARPEIEFMGKKARFVERLSSIETPCAPELAPERLLKPDEVQTWRISLERET